jgi:hypothetical protein
VVALPVRKAIDDETTTTTRTVRRGIFLIVLVVVVVLGLPARKAIDDEDDYGEDEGIAETLNLTAPDLRLASHLSNDVVMDGVHRG